jgi:hypothetical protein
VTTVSLHCSLVEKFVLRKIFTVSVLPMTMVPLAASFYHFGMVIFDRMCIFNLSTLIDLYYYTPLIGHIKETCTVRYRTYCCVSYTFFEINQNDLVRKRQE